MLHIYIYFVGVSAKTHSHKQDLLPY